MILDSIINYRYCLRLIRSRDILIEVLVGFQLVSILTDSILFRLDLVPPPTTRTETHTHHPNQSEGAGRGSTTGTRGFRTTDAHKSPQQETEVHARGSTHRSQAGRTTDAPKYGGPSPLIFADDSYRLKAVWCFAPPTPRTLLLLPARDSP